jgi:hypothetical protein
MNRLALGGAHALLALVITAGGACSSGSDDDNSDSGTEGGAEVVDDALLPERDEEREAPDLITSDGGYRCSATQDVVIDGDGLRVGVIDECASVMIRGSGNEVDLWGAGAVTIEGTNHDIGLVSHFVTSVFVNGEGQRVHLNGADSVTVNGSGNSVDVVSGSGLMTLTGADHRIQLPSNSGVALVTDDSAGSQIEGNYTESPSVTPAP